MYLSMDGLYLLARHQEVHPHACGEPRNCALSRRLPCSPPTEICFNPLQCHEIRVLLDESFEILAGHGFVRVPTAAHLNQNTLLRRRGHGINAYYLRIVLARRLGHGLHQIAHKIAWCLPDHMVISRLELHCQPGRRIGQFQCYIQPFFRL